MRASDLIKDENYFLPIPVNKKHPEVGAIGGIPWAPLKRTVN